MDEEIPTNITPFSLQKQNINLKTLLKTLSIYSISIVCHFNGIIYHPSSLLFQLCLYPHFVSLQYSL